MDENKHKFIVITVLFVSWWCEFHSGDAFC